MCAVSMVGDHFTDKWKSPDYTNIFNNFPAVSRAEFEALKKEVEEMKTLIKKAALYDKANNEPACEMEDKIKLLKQIAKLFDIDLTDALAGK